MNYLLDAQIWLKWWRNDDSQAPVNDILNRIEAGADSPKIWLSPTNFEELLLGIKSSNFRFGIQQLRRIAKICGSRVLPFPAELVQNDFRNNFSDLPNESYEHKREKVNYILSAESYEVFAVLADEWTHHIMERKPKWADGVTRVKEIVRAKYRDDQDFREEVLDGGREFWTKSRLGKWSAYLDAYMIRFRLNPQWTNVHLYHAMTRLLTFVCFATSYDAYHSLLTRSQLEERESDYFDLEQLIYLDNSLTLVTDDKKLHRIAGYVPMSIFSGKLKSSREFVERTSNVIRS